jgi:hypothetical protein
MAQTLEYLHRQLDRNAIPMPEDMPAQPDVEFDAYCALVSKYTRVAWACHRRRVAVWYRAKAEADVLANRSRGWDGGAVRAARRREYRLSRWLREHLGIDTIHLGYFNPQ